MVYCLREQFGKLYAGKDCGMMEYVYIDGKWKAIKMEEEEEEDRVIHQGDLIFNLLVKVTRKVDNEIEVGVSYVGYANGHFLEASH